MSDLAFKYSTKTKTYAIVNAILFLFAVTFSVNYLIELLFIFTSVLLVYILIEKTYIINKLDWLIIAFFLYEIVSWIVTQPINGNNIFANNQYLVLCYWFILRLSLNQYDVRELYLILISVLCAIIAGINAISFEIYKNKIYSAGFNDLYNFRYLHKPFGELNNVWATLFLISFIIIIFFLLSTKCINNYRKWVLAVCSILISYSLIISFSRGIYICIFLIIILLIIYICQIKIGTFKKIILFAGLLAVVSIPSILYKKEVLTTLKMTETASQKRSLENRLSSLSLLLPTVINKPILGIGANNYSLAVNEFIYEDDNRSFTNFSPNVISQLFVEKGIVGTLLWGLIIFLSIIIVKNRRQNKFVSIVMIFFICILFIRELSFSCILNSLKGQIMCSILLLVFVNVNDAKDIRGKQITYKFFMPFIVLLAGLSLFITFINRAHDSQYDKVIGYMQQGAFDDAEKVICGMRNSTPVYLLSSSLYFRLFELRKDTMFLHKGINTINKAIKENPYDTRLIYTNAVMSYYAGKEVKAEDLLRKLVGKHPNNALYNMSLGKYLYLIGNKIEAKTYISKSVILYPDALISDWSKSIKIIDSAFHNAIMEEVYNYMDIEIDNPILLAKYGKILFIEGNYLDAKLYLTKAVDILPNLIYPWSFLAIIAFSENDNMKFNEYARKAKLYVSDTDILKKNPMDSKSTFMSDISNYYIKYETWYSLRYNKQLLDITMVN